MRYTFYRLKTSIAAIIFLSLLSCNLLFANEGQVEKGGTGEGESFDLIHLLSHHIGDDYRFHIIGETYLPLPLILYTPGEGLSVFLSSNFNNESHSYNGYVYDENHLNILRKDNKKFYNLSITKNVFSMMLIAVIMLLMFIPVARSYEKRRGKAPKGLQSFMEPIIIFIRDEVVKASIGEAKYKKYLPYMLTLFFFIWFCNMIGLIPIFPGTANITGNIAVTGALAFLSLMVINVSGNRHYWQHIIWPPGMPIPVKIILFPIELSGIIAKPFALMIRLFANMAGGHILIISIISLIFMFGPAAGSGGSVGIGLGAIIFNVFMYIIKLFVAALQAYIFVLLTALFIGQAVAEPEPH